MTEGLLLVDKPAGVTSYDVVRAVKRAVNERKVGHGGTLDPFATGLLVILIGRRYTKLQDQVMGGRKVYQTVFRLGVETDTGDRTGTVIRTGDINGLTIEAIESALQAFSGEIEQKPHPYSAVKYQGRPLYYYARQGIKVPIEPRKVHLHEWAVIKWEPPELTLKLEVSKGFYVRSLAFDLGRSLGVGAAVLALRRLSIGRFHVDVAVCLDLIRSEGKGIEDRLLTLEEIDVSGL
jgi:tRNA pseudouridine55 synthase